MTTPDLVGLFVIPLNTLDLRYMVTGAVAAIAWGEPRLTRDIDVVVDLHPADAQRFADAFPDPDFYVAPAETIVQESERSEHGHFNVLHIASALKADIYVAGRDPLHAWALERRVRHDAGGVPMWLAPIEYVIVRKLQWYRDGQSARHLDDIRAVMRVNGPAVDRPALSGWIDRLGLGPYWPSDVEV